ncbi:helix-turn-helix domain-containing protein [Sphingobacterium sp. SYP-B4668]|uniref:helix-turn-helix domain-containing protein n=1 Tax=Sphingobacterium sp. SYP-B4668 TaxID=2996035 RepID=UPI0022DDBC57|nr:helix-turn-helix transcriptional regulator [Sphingobacterium sp. SYP-B4668]
MKTRISVKEFFDEHGLSNIPKEQFNVYKREEFACHTTFLKNNRRDFYKITLIVEGEGILSTANKAIHINGSALTFRNPMIPYSWEPISERQTGYFCLFTDDFINNSLKKDTLIQTPLFQVGANQIYLLDDNQRGFLQEIFKNMSREVNSKYTNKYDLLRNYVQIVMHEALKMTPPTEFYKPTNAGERLTSLFVELLEQQFRIDFADQAIRLKNANEYANHLMVHVNHLNKTLKETTGKTTSELIAARIANEARSLLLSTNWDISEIAYCLGFEHASNFNTFFKRNFGSSPSSFRNATLSIE